MMKKYVLASVLLLLAAASSAQTSIDTTLQRDIKTVTVGATRISISSLPPVRGTYLMSGKKSEVIGLGNLDANIAERNARQIFAKVPGVFVYDMDGSGNQLSIATRGLDPHRGWEFNMRRDGIITNSDMYGYPASHYNIPMEAVERIELVRGTGSLQYGAQFGGMLNYVTKTGDTTRQIGLESIHSVGSFGMMSSFHALGGKTGRLQYYAYHSRRHSDGYRDNARSDYNAQGVHLQYQAGRQLSLNASLTRSIYQYQLPGPLTDSLFAANPRAATRTRSFYSPEIFIPSLSALWQAGPHTSLQWTISAVLGARNSVLFDQPATIPDTINALTLQYAHRQVDIDRFNSYTAELRLLHHYRLAGMAAVFAGGLQLMNNDLHRRQQGKGTTGTDYDLSLAGSWGRDLHFKTDNLAFFAEQKINISPTWSISPGLRIEMGASQMSGLINYLPGPLPPLRIDHRFPLFGVNTNWDLNENSSIYGGFSQAYRPVIFKDLIPGSVLERVDDNIANARGYNAELGYRGRTEKLYWDLSLFALRYNNRPGNLVVEEGNDFYILKTNVGNSMTIGVEAFAEYQCHIAHGLKASVFTSSSWFDGRYLTGLIRTGSENRDISGNRIESVPGWISRSGLSLRKGSLSGTLLYSYTAETFADPLNTVQPSATGSVGIVPAYHLLDFNGTWRMNRSLVVRFSINNLTNLSYFTKRPAFYPGPGIWPSDGRSVVLTLVLTM